MAKWKDLQMLQITPTERRGMGQGYFRYYRSDGSFKALVAVDGKLLVDGGDLPITGLPDGFQKTRPIEAVQWKDKLFIATGTELVEYDGTEAKVVEPYKPNPLEALYVGTNGLMDFPDNYLTNGTGNTLQINGVIPDKRYGIANKPTVFSVFTTKPEGMVLEYKYEYGKKDWAFANEGKDNLVVGKDWSTDSTWSFTPSSEANWTIRVSVRRKANSNETTPGKEEVYTIPTYKVTAYDENVSINTSWVKTCTNIMLYWDRLILYGDTTHKTQVYISHLSNPRYFPVNNTLDFENPEQEPISKIISYRDMLIIFMPSSIQGLLGKAPTGDSPFTRHVINSSIGCIAPETAKVMGNLVVFLSKDGVHVLKSFAFNENRMNVEQIDMDIHDQIRTDTNACGIVFDGQYHLTFPDITTRFRYYADSGVWCKDTSPYFDFARMYDWKNDLVVQSLYTGEIYQFSKLVYNDIGYVYEDRILTKSFDMAMPYNPKKWKELQILTTNEAEDAELSVEVKSEGQKIVTTARTDYIIGPDGSLTPVTVHEPNLKINAGTIFGEWQLGEDEFGLENVTRSTIPIAGKGRNISVDIRNKMDAPQSVLGLGFIFKVKKP